MAIEIVREFVAVPAVSFGGARRLNGALGDARALQAQRCEHLAGEKVTIRLA